MTRGVRSASRGCLAALALGLFAPSVGHAQPGTDTELVETAQPVAETQPVEAAPSVAAAQLLEAAPPAVAAPPVHPPEPATVRRSHAGEAAVTGHFFAGSGVLGGGVIGDVGLAVGPVRAGLAFGAAAFSSDDVERSRTFMPLAASVAVRFGGVMGLDLRLRGGMWGGGVSDRLDAGGFFSGGAFGWLRLSEAARITLGAEAWFLVGGDAIFVLAPGLGLQWNLDAAP